ncbi:MAG: VWA domain-containing protein [Candidatus Aminicenantes bacterium]|nr:MAG: VWA domain-containing protein [Candidatus Aminicenantes bacterium]
MNSLRKRAVGLILSLLAFFFVPNQNLLSPQERNSKTTLQHKVSVNLKLIQVYVTDKKGNPVVDLIKEDFLIRENGAKKQITEFEKHILHLSPSETKAPKTIPESKTPTSQDLMSRKFFLLFDFAYNNPKGIKKAKKAALHFMDTQAMSSDEVGVLSYSAIKSLTLHEYLTRDHTEVRKVIEAFGTKNRGGRAENFEDEYWFQATGENPLDPSKRGKITFKEGAQRDDRPVTGSTPDWDKFNTQEDSNVHAIHFVQKIKDFAEALKYIPGYKHIILFSSGIPYSLMYGVQHPNETWNVTKGRDTIIQQSWDFGNSLVQQHYKDMLKVLAASNSTVFTIDTEDLISTVGLHSRLTGCFSLQNIASSTGGKYFGNINSYENHFERIQDLTGCFYVLGYYIDEKWDGKYHKIKVKVNRPGLEVHAQKGYFNPKPFNKFSKLEKMLHLVDLALNKRSLFRDPFYFPLISLPYSVKGDTYISMFSLMPKEYIQEFSGKNIEIVSLIFDEENSIVKIGRNKKDFSKLPEGNMYYSNFTSLHPGKYQCRLIIRNAETGQGAVASSSVIVPKRLDHGIKLYPPLLLKPERNAFYLGNPSADYPFNTRQYFPIVEQLEQGTSRVWAAVRCSFSGIQPEDIQLSTNLIHSSSGTGKVIPATITILDRHHDIDTEIFLLEIQTEGLKPGEYFLYLFATSNLTQSRSGANATFQVK